MWAIFLQIGYNNMETLAHIPMKTIGPVKIVGPEVNDEVMVPLATFESPLWPSTNRGAKVSRQSGGIKTVIVDEKMTRSIVLEADSVVDCHEAVLSLRNRMETLRDIVAETSRFARLVDIHQQIVGNLLYIRFEFFTADASGHNMVTQAADHLMAWILQTYPQLRHVSVSGNFCVDKKVSAVNGILGRGKNVICEMLIPRDVCIETLKTTPDKIVQLNIKKNLIGSMIAGGIRTANAHFANMLLGFYLATGQDVANIVEGSQGFVHTELRGEDLYFSATIPNIIVGAIGNGKDLDFVKENLKLIGCLEDRDPGMNARRLAMVAGATVMCGELSLLAAQTNPGELMRSHVSMERRQANDTSSVT